MILVMLMSVRRVAILVSVMTVALGACSATDTGQGQAKAPGPAPQNEFWIEAPAASGEVREYYKGRLRRVGLEEVYVVLVITQKDGSSSRPYEMTEYQTNFGYGLTTTRSSGTMTIEALRGTMGETAAYRLDGGGTPSQARVLVKTSDRLYVLKDPAVLNADGNREGPLHYAAKAAHGRVEMYADISIPEAHVRLRVGDTLVVRSIQDAPIKAASANTALRQEGSSKEGDYQVLTFKAVAAGATPLLFENIITGELLRNLVIANVKVE